jgi:hypothetical protein
LLSKNIKTQIYRTVILPVVLYGCEAWSLTLREEHRLQVFENRVLRKISGPKDRVTGSAEDYLTRSFMLCTPHHQSGDHIKKNETGGACSTYRGQERFIQGFSGET